jgi:hypothetical protein
MARERGLNPNWQANVSSSEYHPILSARLFQKFTQEHGGATMDVNTGEFVDASDETKDTYVVGKEPDTAGNPIPTIPLNKEALGTPDIANETSLPEMVSKFPKMVSDIRSKTGGRKGASIGSWITTDKAKNPTGVDIDASAQEPDLGQALQKAKVRNEKAIFSTKKLRQSGYEDGDIDNPHYKESK